jgi:hypothetical protein
MWAIVGIVFCALLACISIMTTIGHALVRDRSEKRNLCYGAWYWDSGMVGKPISTREPMFVGLQGFCSLVMLCLFGLTAMGRDDQRVIAFILAFVLCAIQVGVALRLRLNYIKADDARQRRIRHDYKGEHPQPVRLRLPQD